jgi:hypothetical protein
MGLQDTEHATPLRRAASEKEKARIHTCPVVDAWYRYLPAEQDAPNSGSVLVWPEASRDHTAR